jgi:hypothetical protein
MKKPALCLSVAAFLLSQTTLLNAQASAGPATDPPCPMHPQHSMHHPEQTGTDAHHAMVENHGDAGMGFSHEKTTHHFRLADNGGAIEVAANDAADKGSIEAIRSHLAHIAMIFADGDFSTPMFVHDAIPPGVTAMKLLKDKIQYRYEPTGTGGRVLIEAADPVALAAIHDFLRFQITDHQTGDPLSLPESKAKI